MSKVADQKFEVLKYYCGRGWPIFPLPPGGKGDKQILTSWKESASTNVDEVEVWHKLYPDGNWAMRTGSVASGGSGVLVVDIDAKSGGFESWDILREENPEPIETVEVTTGGGGTHLWFEQDGRSLSGKQSIIGKGIDHRADNNYVVVPPSKTKAGYVFDNSPRDTEIQPMPKWLLDAIEKRSATASKGAGSEGPVPQGERHQRTQNIIMPMYDAGLDRDTILTVVMANRDLNYADGYTDEEIEQQVEWAFKKDKNYKNTDMGNAERFTNDHMQHARYVHQWGTWILWDGRRWRQDEENRIQHLARDSIRKIYGVAERMDEGDARKNLAKHAWKSESRQSLNSMLSLAQAMMPANPEYIDAEPMLLNCLNGTVDMRTGVLMKHNRADMLTQLLDIEYDPQAECPKWVDALRLWTGNDDDLRYFLQVAVGYSLTGNIDEHCLFLLHGQGANGKSTFLEVIRRVFGEFTTKFEMESIYQSFGKGGAPTPDVVQLKGKRFVLASEVAESRKLNEPLVKDLTGGDVIHARTLHKEYFDFLPTHKLWLHGNHQPRISGTDVGIWRRIRKIPFAVTIPEDTRRPMSKLMAEFTQEAAGILTWAIHGCIVWVSEGRLPANEAVALATAEYKTEQDVLQGFLNEQTESAPEYSVDKKELFKRWGEWIEDQNEVSYKKMTQRWFTTRILGFEQYTSGGAGGGKLIGLQLLMASYDKKQEITI